MKGHTVENLFEHDRNIETLQLENELLCNTVANIEEGVIVFSQLGDIVHLNSAARKILQIDSSLNNSDQRISGYSLLLPDERTTDLDEGSLLFHILHGMELEECEIFVQNRNVPEGVWVSIVTHPLYNSEGIYLGAAAIFHDITQAKEAQAAFQVSQKLNHAILNSLTSHIAVLDNDGNIIYVNDAWIQFTNNNDNTDTYYPKIGDNYFDVLSRSEGIYSEKAPMIQENLSLILQKSLSEFSLEYECVSGLKRGWFILNVTPLPGDEGGAVVLHTDITERKHSEIQLIRAHNEALKYQKELQNLNRKLLRRVDDIKKIKASVERENRTKSVLLETVSSILIGIDEKDCITFWNPAAENVLAIPASSVLGKIFSEVAINWNWELILSNVKICRESGKTVRSSDMHYSRLDGGAGILGLSLSPIILDSGIEPGVLISGADITERKLFESQLAQAQKMESIGQLAAGIAHEINTPTQYIGDNIHFLEDSFSELLILFTRATELLHHFEEGQSPQTIIQEMETAFEQIDMEYLMEEAPKAIQQSLEGIARVSNIVNAMKEFSHPGTGEMVAIDINHAIESTITVTRNEWKYVADIVMDFDTCLPMIPCFPGEFNQIILNIVINAAHAIADAIEGNSAGKGEIRVSTRNEGDWVGIYIQDTGGGVPEAIRSKIFDPFFTTKGVGKGTGQGLAIAHSSVVDKHGGKIRFETEIGKGTTFIIHLPLVQGQSKRERAA